MTDTATLVNHEDTLAQARELIQRRGISQGLAAKEMGISPTTLTQLLNDTYGADPSAQLGKVLKWVNTQAEAKAQPQLPPVPTWVSTVTAERVISALGYAQLAGDIAVVYGAAGLGKTTASQEYKRRYSNVWIATITPATDSVAACLEEICLALGMKSPPHRASRLQREILSRIANTGGLLILDEAQHLSVAALDTVRALHDATGIGLALVGNEAVQTRMTGGTRAANLDRLYSRIGKRIRLARPQKSDVERIAKLFGVSEASSLACLEDVGKKAGALRMVVKVLRLATMRAGGGRPSTGDIDAAWKDLGV